MSKQTSVKPVTVGQGFCNIPVAQCDLMRVEDGVPLEFAVTQLNCILDCIKELAGDGVQDDGISSRKAWLIEFCLDVAQGLGHTIEVSIERGGTP
ncbi:DUF3077 domain-containing protein [Dyella marensis]|uniref:DUF3077 domain-containing protein n=1 Tax=Dyella marensis TaxID=500610 RepID=A0A1I2A960_9GAMM|nr:MULTISPECIES: DUF3077 domain-containing protein [Dyella]SFE40594.1 Protein of unknown function [Dyella marensis]